MTLTLGILLGLAVAQILIVISLYLHLRNLDPIEHAFTWAEHKTLPKAEIIFNDDVADARQELLDLRKKQGLDTPIEDLG